MQIDRTRGDTISDVFTVTTVATGVVTNLTGYSFKMTLNTLKNPPDAATQLYQLIGNVAAPETGQVTFTPSAPQADHVGLYYYDIEMTDPFGSIVTLVKGVYQFSQDITK